ncbi:hypothetical protein [Sporisorium scitamineum]|uniref:Uncharacterized protein n=1 Tax=Sporisorium scitamineum TaxID=49012 RepID=A0A0F7S935_9BASI|nr:hypothetical protein [Sporisorium scitamineum]
MTTPRNIARLQDGLHEISHLRKARPAAVGRFGVPSIPVPSCIEGQTPRLLPQALFGQRGFQGFGEQSFPGSVALPCQESSREAGKEFAVTTLARP